jgi:hypothetical protein
VLIVFKSSTALRIVGRKTSHWSSIRSTEIFKQRVLVCGPKLTQFICSLCMTSKADIRLLIRKVKSEGGKGRRERVVGKAAVHQSVLYLAKRLVLVDEVGCDVLGTRTNKAKEGRRMKQAKYNRARLPHKQRQQASLSLLVLGTKDFVQRGRDCSRQQISIDISNSKTLLAQSALLTVVGCTEAGWCYFWAEI